MSGSSMNRKSEPKKTTSKKIAEKWGGAEGWADGLTGLPQVHEDHPSLEWLEDVQGTRSGFHMTIEVAKFVDYYNAPNTRDLKAWKTAFRTWIMRSVEQFDSSEVVMHDPTLPKGECECRMCLRRAKASFRVKAG